MKLVDNWRLVLRYAWSVRLIVLAAVLSGLEVALPFVDALQLVPAGAFAALSFSATAGAFVARIAAQRQFQGDA